MKSNKTTNLIILLGIYAIALIVFRVFYTKSGFYLFLIWNLFLAIIPFLITNYLKRKNSKSLLFLLFPIWLLFLPNAPYIITDLVHLQQGTLMPFWFDLLLVLTFSVNGMILFFNSLYDMFTLIKEKYSSSISWIITSLSIFLSGFGIYLGRYLRFNSWDIIQNPLQLIKTVFQPIMHPTQHPKTWGITIGFGLFFIICFLFYKSLFDIKKETTLAK